jgi:hypothetical protein
MTSVSVVGRIAAAVVLCGAMAAPAFAQGPYVGASIGADIARFSGTDGVDASGTGEAFSWAIKVGTPIASRFGVEVEFSRPQEITQSDQLPIRILNEPSVLLAEVIGAPSSLIFPPFEVRTSQRNTTIATTAWVRQEVTPRFSMAYLGGVSFVRTSYEFAYEFAPLPFVNTVSPTILPRSSRSTQYSVAPIVGAEGRLGMTEHMVLVPGVRMQSLSGGWLVRPSVGVQWEF